MLTDHQKAGLVKEYTAQANGTERLHMAPLGLVYSDGLKFVADTCGAYWLLDAVASHQPAIKRRHVAHFQVWELAFRFGRWNLSAWSDSPREPGSELFAEQPIPYSDFPKDLSPFTFYVEGGVALLKEER